jgi:hypothetical protein
MGEREGQGRRLSPLPFAQLCRSPLPAPPPTLSAACGIPSCGGSQDKMVAAMGLNETTVHLLQ